VRLDRIVVGIDFSPASTAALRWVVRHLPDAELVLAHAIDPVPGSSRAGQGDAEQALRARLQAIADSLGSRKPVRIELREDRPPAALAYVAESSGADLIAVGPHGGEESTPGIGSTAERLIRMSPIPVLLVAHPRDRAVQRVVVAADQVDLMPEVMHTADAFARGEGAQVTLAHVFDPRIPSMAGWQGGSVRPDAAPEGYPSFQDYVKETEGWLAGLARELTGSPHVELAVPVGEPGREIVALAGRADADLVVMGRRGRWRRLPAVIGSTASTVLRESPCPVLIIVDPPEARFEPWEVKE
jgi:nucleotide-binding universal stress UspA family protein